MILSALKSQTSARLDQSISMTPPVSPQNVNLQTWAPLTLPATPLFGTDGIRGQAGELLTAPLALQVGFWAGHVLRNHARSGGTIIIGQDSRNSSDMLAMSLSAGLTAAGLEVWNVGLCPTPGVAYLTAATGALSGVMISASHNPPEDNGIKFFDADGSKLSQTLQDAIDAALRGHPDIATSHSPWGRHYHRPELIDRYIESLTTSSQGQSQGMRIVLDLAWGAAVPVAPAIFRAIGAEVICIHDRADGDRINVNCGSTHLGALQAAVLEYNADLGIAFDGDADRAIAVDKKGRPVNGDYILYLWGQTLRQAQQLPANTIVSTVMANLGFQRAWERQGGQLIRTPVGDRHVQAEMVKTGAMLGGEQSGHILCRHYSVTGDGPLTALHLATLVAASGVTLSELVDRSFQTYPQLLRNVRVEDRQTRLNWQQCQPLQRAIDRASQALGDSGRVLVRASGTEPVIRVMVEADRSDLTSLWAENLVLAVQQHLA